MFLIMYADRPRAADGPRDFEPLYRQWRDYVQGFVQGELHGEADAALAGHAARDFRIDMGKRGLLLGRVIQVEGETQERVYVLVAVGGHIKSVPADGERFLHSFALP
jgi:hypothetical protein